MVPKCYIFTDCAYFYKFLHALLIVKTRSPIYKLCKFTNCAQHIYRNIKSCKQGVMHPLVDWQTFLLYFLGIVLDILHITEEHWILQRQVM